jgi:hypothetical protein
MVDHDRKRNRGSEGLRRGWSKSGTLIANGDGAQSLTIQQVFDEASDYVIQFGLVPHTPPDTFPAIRCQATILWTVEGNTIIRKVDVGNGVTVQGCAGAVKVMITDATVLVASPPHTYDVSINVSPGSRASTNQVPTLFEQLVTLGPGASALIVIPQNAGIISVDVDVIDVTDFAHTPIELQASQVAGAPPGVFQWAPVLHPGFVPIVPSANLLSLVNHHSADTFHATVLWGIDG